MKTHNQKSDEDSLKASPIEEAKRDEEKKDAWKDDYLRVLADYRNLVKRTEEEKKETWTNAVSTVVEKLLPVFDNLERADAHLKDQGLTLALQEAASVLKSLGVQKTDSLGKSFDPYSMDCVDVVEGEPNMVVSIVESGYMLRDRVLRPAKVTVGKTENIDEHNGKNIS